MSHSDLIFRLNKIQEELQIYAKLKGITISARHIATNSKKTHYYHLMELDTKEEKIFLRGFPKNQLHIAELVYRDKEDEIKDDPSRLVVLISAGNINDIKKAYPNFFLDTNDFIKQLKRICGK